jgi:FkbM family methyltransferase
MQGTLAILVNKGVRFGTAIDLGCADGNFYLTCLDTGLLPGAACINVDANALYEPSLREIQQVMGGHYLIAAVSDSEGEVEMHSGSHAYWASALPTDSSYWASSHNRPNEPVKVPATTLDALVKRFAPKPPFLVKLDLQGYEINALRGGQAMLAQTDAIICETAHSAFASICEFLTSNNFGLFDLTEMSRLSDGTLVEIYPVFLNRRLDHIRATQPWDPSQNELMIQQMNQRRQQILEWNAKVLAKYRAAPGGLQLRVQG